MIYDGVHELDACEFEKFIAEGTTLIDFFAEWCMPCLIMGPIFDEMAEKFRDKMKFGKVNVDDNQQLASKLKILSIPTTIAFSDGKELKRFSGAMQSEELERHIEGILAIEKTKI